MTVEEVRKKIADMIKQYGILYSRAIEHQMDGEIKYVDLEIRFKIDDEKKS